MTTDTTPVDLDSILRKVQALLANADDPATPDEARDSYRAKAEGLMFKYRIDSAMTRQAAPEAFRAQPVWRTITVCSSSSEFSNEYRAAAYYVLHHTGCEGVFRQEQVDGRWTIVLHAVGFEAETRFAELIITNVLLAFQAKLEPGVNRQLSDDENAYNLRHAGWEGGRIAQALWGTSDKAARSKARNAFRRHAVSLGEDPAPLLGQGNSVKLYRKSYADSFTTELYYRLSRMARERSGDEKGLVLAGQGKAVKEALYEKFPHLRPVEREALPSSTMHEDCGKCKKAKSGYCRDHSYLRPRAYREERTSRAGQAAGSAAARSVDLGVRGSRVEGADRAAIG